MASAALTIVDEHRHTGRVKETDVRKQSAEQAVVTKKRRAAPLSTPTDLKAAATRDVAGAMNAILADVFAMYLKTKNFHWHMSGPHFRDYHLLIDEQATQLYAMTDPIAERVRKLGGTTLRSIGQIARMQRIADNDAEYVETHCDPVAVSVTEQSRCKHSVVVAVDDQPILIITFTDADQIAEGIFSL